jgi:hypothetical protein
MNNQESQPQAHKENEIFHKEQKQASNIIPCPYCGVTPNLEDIPGDNGTSWHIECLNSDCLLRPRIHGFYRDWIIDEWNKPQRQVAELRCLLEGVKAERDILRNGFMDYHSGETADQAVERWGKVLTDLETVVSENKTELMANKHIIDFLRLEVERLQQEHQFLVKLGIKIPTTVEEVEIAETVLGKDEKIRNLTLIHEEHKRSIKRLREILQLKPGEDLQDALRALIEERDWLKAYYDDRNSPSVAPGI